MNKLKPVLIVLLLCAIALLIYGGACSKKSSDKNTVVTGSSTPTPPPFPPTWLVTSNPTTGYDTARAVVTDSSYLYIIGNENGILGDGAWRIEKREKITGTLVTAFGSNGVVTSNPCTREDTAKAVVADDNYLYIVGSDAVSWYDEWRIEKRDKTTGALVGAFGSNGVITSNPSAYYDMALAVTADTDYLYVAGYDEVFGNGNAEFRIEKREKITGTLVTAFGSEGVITSNPTTYADVASAIVLDENYLYVVGRSTVSAEEDFYDMEWRIEKRDKTTGALVGAFGSGGVITSNPTANTGDVAYAVTIDTNYLYIVGYGPVWRIEKRDKITGALVDTFGLNGVITSIGQAFAVQSDGDYLYIAGVDYTPGSGNGEWRIEKRDKTSGALVTAFGNGGVINVNPSRYQDIAWGIVVEESVIYIVGYDESLGYTIGEEIADSQWRIEKRNKTSGSQ